MLLYKLNSRLIPTEGLWSTLSDSFFRTVVKAFHSVSAEYLQQMAVKRCDHGKSLKKTFGVLQRLYDVGITWSFQILLMATNHFKCSLHCISIFSLACRRTARDAEELQLTLSISTKFVLSFSLSWFVQYSAFHTHFCNNHLMKNHAMLYFRSCNAMHNVYLALSPLSKLRYKT